jgi:hypothetical protein
VVEFIAREDAGDAVADGFEEQEKGFSVADSSGYVDEFGDEEQPF